ncbi:succinyl-diaminopimelate desuccinylase [Zavarzinia sp. CC-PAN008]|uniref:succinyl-diaminopimelate desuccinylase n=1 Tax=Zavarzinia sp. CC-PAN008 TaxID=3243332 RepID=UPI003F749B08
MAGLPDPVDLAAALIRRPSVTPADAGALDVLERTLADLGFACHRLRFEAPGTEPIENLYAEAGQGAPHFCFAGHTDVVPTGPEAEWSEPPFAGTLRDGFLWGRGAADMKGAIAAFVAAAAERLQRGPLPGTISLLITGDEEGPAVNGTVRVLDWLEARGIRPDFCVVGEPTNPDALGDMMKVGRRGSITARIAVEGVQGHVAYPTRADNPLPRLIRLLERLNARVLDEGTEHFQPSNLEITTIDVGNPASNVIPGRATAQLNIRFNDLHSGADLQDWIAREVAQVQGASASFAISGESFLSPPGPYIDLVAAAVAAETGRMPERSTSGGTSDARFIRRLCPVVEFGLVGQTMHKVDERVPAADIVRLTRIYGTILDRFFAA